jgi:poly(3-hydroxybutyrate) depolymerase
MQAKERLSKETASKSKCQRLARRLFALLALVYSCNASLSSWAQAPQSRPPASSSNSNSSSTSNKSSNLAGSDKTRTLQVGQLKRSYVIHRPENLKTENLKTENLKTENLNTGKRVPLVIVLHGGGGNASNAASMSLMSEKSESLVFPMVA